MTYQYFLDETTMLSQNIRNQVARDAASHSSRRTITYYQKS